MDTLLNPNWNSRWWILDLFQYSHCMDKQTEAQRLDNAMGLNVSLHEPQIRMLKS